MHYATSDATIRRMATLHIRNVPDELYEKLKPFKEQVAEDIKESDGDD